MLSTTTFVGCIRYVAKTLIPAFTLVLACLSTSVANANTAPAIQSFTVNYLGDGWWELYGVINDEAPEYCAVFFSGVLDGYSVDVSSNGEFALIVEIPSSVSGAVDANALDPEYAWSDVASGYVSGGN